MPAVYWLRLFTKALWVSTAFPVGMGVHYALQLSPKVEPFELPILITVAATAIAVDIWYYRTPPRSGV